MLLALTNDTSIKYSMETQDYKIVNTHAHEISWWEILSRLIHLHAPNFVGMNGNVQSDLTTPEFKIEKNLNIFISELSDFNRK